MEENVIFDDHNEEEVAEEHDHFIAQYEQNDGLAPVPVLQPVLPNVNAPQFRSDDPILNDAGVAPHLRIMLASIQLHFGRFMGQFPYPDSTWYLIIGVMTSTDETMDRRDRLCQILHSEEISDHAFDSVTASAFSLRQAIVAVAAANAIPEQVEEPQPQPQPQPQQRAANAEQPQPQPQQVAAIQENNTPNQAMVANMVATILHHHHPQQVPVLPQPENVNLPDQQVQPHVNVGIPIFDPNNPIFNHPLVAEALNNMMEAIDARLGLFLHFFPPPINTIWNQIIDAITSPGIYNRLDRLREILFLVQDQVEEVSYHAVVNSGEAVNQAIAAVLEEVDG